MIKFPMYASIVFLAVLLYGAVHSALASLTAKARARRWFGNLGVRTYRLLYNLFAVLSLLPVLALTGLLPDRLLYTIPFPWVGITLAGQLLAVLALAVGLLQTGPASFFGIRQLLAPDPARECAAAGLVVTGLYRWVRHPLYTAGLVFIWLVPRMTLNMLAFNLGATVYIILGAILEERKLLREFGEAYDSYRRTTPMLFPGIK